MACPSTPCCPGQPDDPFARWALANKPFRCSACHTVALAYQWRSEGRLRAGRLLSDSRDDDTS